MSSRGNSPTYYKRLNKLLKSKSFQKKRKQSKIKRKSKTPRVPMKKRGESPRHHSDLFVDEEESKSIKGLKFKNEKVAKESVKRLRSLYKSRKVSYAHAKQAGMALEQRSRFHAHPTPEIKKANKVWKKFLKSFRK
jgi:hypothetical protein